MHGDESGIGNSWLAVHRGDERGQTRAGGAAEESQAIADELAVDAGERGHVGDGGDHGKVEQTARVLPGAVADVCSSSRKRRGEEQAESS